MIKTYHRAPTELEIEIGGTTRKSLMQNLITVTLPVSGLIFAVTFLIRRSVFLAAAAAGCLFLASLSSSLVAFRKTQRHRGMLGDTEAVEVLEVSADSVIDIEPVGDDGPAYCFFTGSEAAILLVGQWLRDYSSFPAMSFCLYRWAATKKCIRIEALGPRVEPEPSTAQLRQSHRYAKVELLKASPRTLQADLDRSLSKN